MPLTRERLLVLLDQVVACTDSACLERLRLAVAGAPATDVHARMVRDLIAMRAREGGRRQHRGGTARVASLRRLAAA
jgi:hypothetical protein